MQISEDTEIQTYESFIEKYKDAPKTVMNEEGVEVPLYEEYVRRRKLGSQPVAIDPNFKPLTKEEALDVLKKGPQFLYSPPTKHQERTLEKLEEDEFIDEKILKNNNESIVFHLSIVSRFKQSEISGSEWRYTAVCNLFWNGQKIATWLDNSIKKLSYNLPRFFDKYLFETKKDIRLNNTKLKKTFFVFDSEENKLETDEEANSYHFGDEEISDLYITSHRLKDRNDFLNVAQSFESDCLIQYRKNGNLIGSLKKKSTIVRSLLYLNPYDENVIFLTINEEKFCNHPGCKDEYKVEYVLKNKYCSHGHKDENDFWIYFRRFCEKHKKRGTQRNEDSDKNYVTS